MEPWILEWTPEQIQRFWNWKATHRASQELYFSKQVGESILDDVARRIPLTGVVVDLGAGPGYLTEKLVARGLRTTAVDTSKDSILQIEQRLVDNPNFAGGWVSTIDHVPLSDSSAQVVFLIETVEHLGHYALPDLLAEARRITNAGGYIVITTPNDEELEANQVLCPNCGCIFHTVQHVRSWDVNTLQATVRQCGFEIVICTPTLFSLYPKWLRPLHRAKYMVQRRKLPHLLCIGQKGDSHKGL